MELGKQTFEIIFSFNPGNIFIQTIQRRTTFTEPLLHARQGDGLFIEHHMKNVACGAPFAKTFRWLKKTPCAWHLPCAPDETICTGLKLVVEPLG